MSETMQQVLITKVFDAPRELVWAAWTDPAHLARWFGPEGFEVPPESVLVELRVGGRYELTMVGGGGGRQPVTYEIVELDPPRLLVLRHDPIPEAGIHEETFTRVELHDHGGKTRMTLSDGPYTEARYAEAGWLQSFEKLAVTIG